jgi:hypothetical protein
MRRSPWLVVVHLKYRGHIVLCEIEMFGLGRGQCAGKAIGKREGEGHEN